MQSHPPVVALGKRTVSSPAERPDLKRLLSDRVVAHAVREEAIERARTTDGERHPHATSTAKKIPASDWERSWLFDYFAAMPAVLSGNYYRYGT